RHSVGPSRHSRRRRPRRGLPCIGRRCLHHRPDAGGVWWSHYDLRGAARRGQRVGGGGSPTVESPAYAAGRERRANDADAPLSSVRRVSAPDFVAIGHVTLDHFGEVVRPGGGALYAAVTALRLGRSAAILTSHGADFPLNGVPTQIEVVGVEAPATTAFEHQEAVGGRGLRARGAHK